MGASLLSTGQARQNDGELEDRARKKIGRENCLPLRIHRPPRHPLLPAPAISQEIVWEEEEEEEEKA